MLNILGWTIFLAPFISFLIIGLITRKNQNLSAKIGIAAIVIAFAASIIAFCLQSANGFTPVEAAFSWIKISGFDFRVGILLDKLSLMMCLIVTGVATGVFIYSTEYMKGDDGFSRYYAFLSFFTFSMLGIVLSNNFVQTFIFWELVGASSYSLIGHWFHKKSAVDASKKAFLTTRMGDVGFIIGILMVWLMTSKLGHATVNFLDLEHLAHGGAHLPVATLSIACVLIFIGAVGKSAQLPLHVWLPDAMEGPTAVSALIHAATMVAAGVYLLARSYFLISMAPGAMMVIAYVGAATAFLMATVALVQSDIKKVLAYSTLSQLGYMVMAVGLGGSGVAMYHLTTHAFFKALLFLGAGSVIHAVHTQNIWQMGGLLKKIPVTGYTFLIGCLALAGVFPLSGFFSKDEILILAFQTNKFLFIIAIVTAFLTAFYVGRLFCTVFLGKLQTDGHESGKAMTLPLIVLAVLSITAGFFGLGHFLHNHADVHLDHSNKMIPIISGLLSIVALTFAYLIYGKKIPFLAKLRTIAPPVAGLLEKKYYFDEFYGFLVSKVQQGFANFCNVLEDNLIIETFVNGSARVTTWFGNKTSQWQTGRIQFYALMFALGLVVLTFFAV